MILARYHLTVNNRVTKITPGWIGSIMTHSNIQLVLFVLRFIFLSNSWIEKVQRLSPPMAARFSSCCFKCCRRFPSVQHSVLHRATLHLQQLLLSREYLPSGKRVLTLEYLLYWFMDHTQLVIQQRLYGEDRDSWLLRNCHLTDSRPLEISTVVERSNGHHAMGRSPNICTLFHPGSLEIFTRALAIVEIEHAWAIPANHFFIKTIPDTAFSLTIKSTRHWRTIRTRKLTILKPSANTPTKRSSASAKQYQTVSRRVLIAPELPLGPLFQAWFWRRDVLLYYNRV